MDWNKDKKLYLRVATTYYKKVDKLLLSGDYHNYLTMWSRQALIDDYGKESIGDIKKFDGFCNYPSHTNYQETIGKLFNTYKKLNYEPKEGSIENFKAYMNHIFQSQYELGLDYFTILYQKPTQALPILCLVSRERGTGKTTILNLSKLIFGDNMTVNKTEDFRSQYNEDWSSELLIGIDEALLDRKEDSERIKNLSTAKTTKSQAKYKQRVEQEFFGKFILCSNHEETFIPIDQGETRYWVIKVKPFEGEEDPFLIEKLEKEIPAIMHFLANRKISTEHSSRMWFHPSLLKTDALRRVINRNKSKAELELASIFNDILYDFDQEEIKFTLTDAVAFLNRSKIRNNQRTQIKEILQQKWQLSPIENPSTYTKYTINSEGNIYETPQAKGRYYTVNKEFIDDKLLNC
ncbi:hypothetical protein MATR_26670 [Marivirga tractuosa]|uniref:NrS-1 polymerase-like helicase domain-containing protein n=1 Tax=Marivirga tractuosa (strain ATCC 23168 / DSM 4126 / NBRC 15989 / NCIMB 1408 / VKM B-1430 / H-43) TaxID=643867 RepID=E4TN91_MARTH|nr:primase-helicase family protein [Marivirga tractuosa]ADR23479.1 hypothetical protein Ftrac_3509 [Marivirga tractuosa DSM 4126]BDD15842.1 hypothetical protein MATR_26670 [Marivirga tractuosa]